jgi:hypothetical protein
MVSSHPPIAFPATAILPGMRTRQAAADRDFGLPPFVVYREARESISLRTHFLTGGLDEHQE